MKFQRRAATAPPPKPAEASEPGHRAPAPPARATPAPAWTTLALGAAPMPSAADPQEQEAERMARRVMSGQAPLCATCGGGGGGVAHLQARADAGGLRGAGIGAAAAAATRGGAGAGAALPAGLRSFYEPRMGTALGDVRLHTDAAATHSAQALNARAYTVGSDVHFGAGQFQPETPSGRHLIAHELTHVLQQRGSGAPRVQRLSWNDVLNFIDPDPNRVCGRELEDAEDWAAGGPYPADPLTMVGADGLGGFDAQYRPNAAQGNGVLQISQGVAVTFKNTLVAAGAGVAPNPDLPVSPEMTALAARVNAIPDAAAKAAAAASYQWSAAEKAPWIAQLEPQIEQGWGGQHEFFLNKPRWEWLGASVAVDLNIGERAKGAADHMDLETYKTPSGESLRTFDISHKVSRGSTTDARDQSMRLASTSVGPKEVDLLRESVHFALGSSDLTAAAQTTLNGFIATFNGANAHVAHQEIRVDVIGHTSARGTEADNQKLSLERAASVQDYLRTHGFVNVATRVLTTGRGESEADQTAPSLASDQRVDLVVDGGARMITAMHEFGHAFGLDDEYGTVGTTPRHDAWARDMTDASGAHLPGAVREHNAGIMSFGTEVRPRHYATFHHALQTVTAQSPWALGPHKAKWQVQMECGAPSPPGDWNLPTPGTGDRTA